MSDDETDAAESTDWEPSKRQWMVRTVFEGIIGLATIATAATAIVINATIAGNADHDRDEQTKAQVAAIDQAGEAANQRNRIDVLTQWLPPFLEGDSQAERMIVTLLPNQAASVFSQLSAELAVTVRSGEEAEDPGAEELVATVDEAAVNASRVEAVTPEFAIVAAEGLDETNAEELSVKLETFGATGVVIVPTEAGFNVLITGFSTEREAETVRALLDDLDGPGEDEESAEIVNLAEQDPVGTLRVVPDVYNCPEDEALAALEAEGFGDVTVWRIPSESVAVGQVRELVLNDGASAQDETEVVNTNGFGDLNVADAPDGRGAGVLEALGRVERSTDETIIQVLLPVDTPLALKIASDSSGEQPANRECGLG